MKFVEGVLVKRKSVVIQVQMGQGLAAVCGAEEGEREHDRICPLDILCCLFW
jgi:hypothetical protein